MRETEKLFLLWLHKEYGMYDFFYENWGVKTILYEWVVIILWKVGCQKIEGVKTISYNCYTK